MLELLAAVGVQATLFVLGKVAEAHPSLAREIAAAGHEVGTHGYSHESIEAMPVARFREELHRSVETLRQQTGQPVLGYGAADFSISGRSLHLLEYLDAEGLAYDSSIFLVRHPRYGVPGAWRVPHCVRCSSGRMLIEFPLSTVHLAGMVLPAAGGGYLRLFPYWWTHLTLRTLQWEGCPATRYIHPYELDTAEMAEIPYRVPIRLRLSQGTNRRSVRSKLRRLLAEFRFIPMVTAYQASHIEPLEVALDLGRQAVVYRPQRRVGCAS